MNRALLLLAVLILPIAALACHAPALATPAPASTPTAQSVGRSALIAISEPAEPLAEACTFIAQTDTNLREWAGVGAPVVGEIKQGESVTAVCPIGGEWALALGRGWFCIAALANNGGCD